MTQWISVLEKDRQTRWKEGAGGCLKVRPSLWRAPSHSFEESVSSSRTYRGSFSLATGGWSVKHSEVAFPSLSYSRYEIASFAKKIPELPREFQAGGAPRHAKDKTCRLPNSSASPRRGPAATGGEMAEKQPPHSYLMFTAADRGGRPGCRISEEQIPQGQGAGLPQRARRASRACPGLQSLPQKQSRSRSWWGHPQGRGLESGTGTARG